LAVEIAPGNVLTGLVRKVLEGGIAVALEGNRLDSVLTLIEREQLGEG
jgi:hypothetical protein